MIQIPEPFRGNENFWELNSQYKMIFDEYYRKDKSSNKTNSSVIMWALAFKLNPESVFYNLPDKDTLIITKFIRDDKFTWDSIGDIESLFKDTLLTQAERSLYEWNEFMKKRDKYLKNTDYYFDKYITDKKGDNVLSKTGKPIIERGTADQLDKALMATPKIFMDYGAILKELKEDKIKKGRGNKPLSSSDANRV